MGNRLSSRSVTNQSAVVVACAAALLWSVSPAFATTIPLPTDESVAVVGAFDIADSGSTTARNRSSKPGYYGVADNSSPTFAPGSFGTPAHGGAGTSTAAAGQEHPFEVLTDGQLVEAIATQGLMDPDVLEAANPEHEQTPGSYTGPSGLVNAGGASTPGGPGDPEAALVFQIPEVITSLSPSVVVVDVGTGDAGGGLHWNADDSSAPGASVAFAGNILTNTDIPMNDASGNAPAASGGVGIGVVANGVAAVPEPASLLLLSGGLAAAGARRWKRRS